MKQLVLILVLAVAAISTQAIAHTRLASSVPADAAEVTTAKELVLDFSADVRLTSVVLQTSGGEEMPLGEIPAGVAKNFTIALTEALATGEYVVAWRSVGADAHVVSGEFRFTVTGN